MKNLLFLLLLYVPLAHAADEWTTGEKVGEATYLTLHTIDLFQTRWIAKHEPNYYEAVNPIIGRYPSVDRVDIVLGATTILQPIIANYLPQRWRDIWIGSGVMLEFTMVSHNMSLGIGMQF